MKNSDFKDSNLIVQSNELIQQTNWNINAIPLKIFKTLISCIDTKNPPIDNKIIILKKELYDLLGSNENYQYLEHQIKSLQSKVVKLKKENGDILSLSLLPSVLWKKSSDEIICKFSDELMPYLINLKENFTKYNVLEIKGFSSKYGLILYEYLLSEKYKNLAEKRYTLEMSYLRKITGTEKKYNDFRNFEKKVLKVAIDDINTAVVSILVDYKKIKYGRKVEYIKFQIRNRNSCQEKNMMK